MGQLLSCDHTSHDCHANTWESCDLTSSSEGVPEANREPKPLLHRATFDLLLRVVVLEAECISDWSVRSILDGIYA